MNSNKPCFYYNNGRCKFGANCFYRHIDPEPLVGITCSLIRHGQSGYNKRLQDCADKYGVQGPTSNIGLDTFQQDATLIDSGLTQEGFRQAQQSRKKMPQQIDIVFVSPLERTLQTANIIFGYRKGLKILVIPELCEVLSKVCDISSSIVDKQKRYPNMDFSLLSGRHLDWQSDFLDPSLTKDFDRCFTKERERSEELIAEFYLNLVKVFFPESIETRQNCGKRVRKALKDIKNMCVKKYKHIAIVAHRRVLREITTTPRNPNGLGFDNCEVVKVDL